jgi:hypothetical protein
MRKFDQDSRILRPDYKTVRQETKEDCYTLDLLASTMTISHFSGNVGNNSKYQLILLVINEGSESNVVCLAIPSIRSACVMTTFGSAALCFVLRCHYVLN